MTASIERRVLDIVRQVCPDEDVRIEADTALRHLGMLNSIRTAELVAWLSGAGFPHAAELPPESFETARTLAAALASGAVRKER